MTHDWAALGIEDIEIYLGKMESFFPDGEYPDFMYGCAKVTLTGSVQAFDEFIGMTKREYGRDGLVSLAEDIIILLLTCPYTDAAYLRQRLEILETHGMPAAQTKGLDFACGMMGGESYAAVFIDLGSSLRGYHGTLMEDAVYDQNVPIIELLLRAGDDASPHLDVAHTCGDKSEMIVRLMLDHGADPRNENVAGVTDGILGDINALHATWKKVFPDFQRELMEYVFAPARLVRMGYFDSVSLSF